MKWLLSILVVVLGFMWWKQQRKRDALEKSEAPPPKPVPRASPKSGASVEMLACAHCGLHMPAHEMVQREGKVYCGEAHAKLGSK